MYKKPIKANRQAGFSPMLLMLIVFIIALALGAWYVWEKGRQSDQRGGDQTHQQATEGNDQDPVSPEETAEYLVIEEWGLRFKLPENLRGDISYIIDDKAHRDFGGPLKVDFISKAFSEGKLKCAENETHRDLVSIYYQDLGANDSDDFNPEPFKVIDGRGYFLSITGCEEIINSQGSDQDKQLLSTLRQAVTDTLEKK